MCVLMFMCFYVCGVYRSGLVCMGVFRHAVFLAGGSSNHVCVFM